VVAPGTGFRLVDTETQQERPLSLMRAQQTVASHDGKAVFYATLDSAPYERGKEPVSDTFRLIRRDLDTGADKELYRAEARPFGVAISLTPSPDGRSLAFAFLRPRENSPRLWILPLSGGEPRELLRSDGLSPAWTQDSRAILFSRSGEIWVQPLDGREPYATGIHGHAPSVSPDGDRIAFIGSTTTESVWMIKNLFPETSARSVRLQPDQSAKR
jgi:Tol biopolymer transport system component